MANNRTVLHLGVLGPRRVDSGDVGSLTPPPYDLVDNSEGGAYSDLLQKLQEELRELEAYKAQQNEIKRQVTDVLCHAVQRCGLLRSRCAMLRSAAVACCVALCCACAVHASGHSSQYICTCFVRYICV